MCGSESEWSVTISHFNIIMLISTLRDITVTALCSFSDLLYVGTSKGVVLQLILQELYSDETYFCFHDALSKRICSKPISRLQASPKRSTLVIFSDESLILCDAEKLETLNFVPSFKAVSSFQLWSFDDEKEKLAEIPLCVCISPQFLCIGLENCYMSVDLRTSCIVELLRSVEEPARKYIAHFTQNEFIVSGPGSLAIIVDTNGMFLCGKNYFFTITDEFFTVHNILTQCQLQTVNLKKPSVACFSMDLHLLFIATSSNSSDYSTNIQVLGPERWDLVARRFIITGCLKQAFCIQENERNRLTQLIQVQAEKFKHEQQLFDMRRQRVLGLLGFYHFEMGEFKKAASYFEQSVIDIREILFRYTDLLPKGCYFMPNWFYRLHQISNTQPSYDEDPQTSGINLVSDLCILRASEDSDNDHDLLSSSFWLLKYEEFLFNFLRKHHQSKFVEKYLHFVETALVKLYVRLQQAGIQPYFYELCIDPKTSYNDYDQPTGGFSPTINKSTDNNDDQGLVDLISNLIHIDVEDLTMYLEKNNAYHALALIYRWQGNLSGALEIWKKLVYNELNDPGFPGVEFYVSILSGLSTTNSSNPPKSSLPSTAIDLSNDVNYEFPVYAELVWNHFLEALSTGHEDIAKELMLRFPIPASYIDSICASPVDEIDTSVNPIEITLAPSQILSPNHIVQQLLSSHPNLAITYLKHLCSSLPNCHPENHNLLAKLYLNTLLNKIKNSDVSSDEMKRQIRELRIEFCHLIRYSLLISHEILLERLYKESVSVQRKLAYELAILEGKANNHTKAVKYLIENMNDYKAALYYCLTFSQQPVQIDTNGDDPTATLIKNNFKSLEQSDVKFDFTKILTRLPSEWNLLEIKSFLHNAIRSTLREWSELHFKYGLTKYDAKLAVLDLPENSQSLIINENTPCSICHQAINVYGPSYNFAWLIRTNEVAHIHCLSNN
ncbi:unnamed protein product [Heterobilharzia americana]|nr:unnamed protein product [Heterobilharzia americana]